MTERTSADTGPADEPRKRLSKCLSTILDDRWPLAGKIMSAVDEYVAAEARQQDDSALRPALERLLANAEHIFDKKPVRDWTETLAEARAARDTRSPVNKGSPMTDSMDPDDSLHWEHLRALARERRARLQEQDR